MFEFFENFENMTATEQRLYEDLGSNFNLMEGVEIAHMYGLSTVGLLRLMDRNSELFAMGDYRDSYECRYTV